MGRVPGFDVAKFGVYVDTYPPPPKTSTAMENPPSEDAFPIEHGDFFHCHVSFQGGKILVIYIYIPETSNDQKKVYVT